MKRGLEVARIVLLFLLVVYAFSFLTASLAYDALRSYTDTTSFDPFGPDGEALYGLNVGVWIFSLLVSIFMFFLFMRFWNELERRKNPFQKTYRIISIFLLLGLAYTANIGAWVSVGKLNLSEKRLTKIIALYGPKEDMCQVLKLGMSKSELLDIMGAPAGKGTIADCHDPVACSESYCSQSGECREVSLNKDQKIIKIECWTGKAVGVPI